MAHDDESQERLNEQNEAHIKLLIRLESEYNRYGGGLKKVINDSITAMKKENLTSLERAKLQNKMVHDLHTEMSSLTKGIKEGKKTQQDLWDATKELSAAMEVVTDETERSTLASVRRDAAFQASGMAFNENLTKLSETIARTTVSTSARFVTQLQTGMSAATAGADMMTGVIDIMGAGAGAAGRATTAFGGAIALANPVVGGFVAGLGTAITFLAETGTALAKFGVQIAKVEVEKTVTSFNTMSSSGAMFAGGMTGMRDAAGKANLTLEQFTAIVKSSSSQLSDSGMSVGEASAFTGRVLAKGGDSMKKSLAKLGYSFEEQGELVAQVMKDMRGSTVGPLQASDAEVAEQTQKYAENLRIIADITGEDAKAKAEANRQISNQLGYQQKLAEKGTTERANIELATQSMSAQTLKDFMDMAVYGQIVNEQGRVAAAALPSYVAYQKEEAALFKKGLMNDQTELALKEKYGEAIHKETMAATGFGVAGMAPGASSTTQTAAANLMGKADEFKHWTKEAVETATKDTKGQKDTKDDLTKNLVGAEVSLQNFQRAMEKDLTPVIAQFGKFTGEMLDGLEDKLADLGLMTKEQLASHEKKKSDQDAMLNAKEGYTIGFGLVANLVESMGLYTERADDRARMESDQASAVTPHAAGTLGVDKSLFKSVPGGEVIRAFEDGPEAVITKDQFDSVVRQVQALTKSSMGAKSTISMDNSKFNATTGVPQTATGAEHVTIKQALKALVDFGKLMKTNVTPALTDFGSQLHDLLDGLGTQQFGPSDEDDEYMPMSRDMDTGEETAMNYVPQGASGGVQGVPGGGGGGANFRKPSDADVAAARSAKPAATKEEQKAYWQKMHDSLLKSATEKGVQNPEAIASLGADQTSLETGYGKHMVGNNAFGIKAKEGAGQVSASTQEFENGRMVTKQQNFRAYDKPEDSTNDYIDFLQKNKRYAAVLAAKNSDEAVAAQAKTGYATDPNYGRKLASINNAMKGQVAQPAVGGNSSDRVTAAQRVVDITDKQLDINKKQQDLVAKHSTAIQASSMVMKPAEDTLAGMANATPATPATPDTKSTLLTELDAKKATLKQSMFGKDGKMSNDDKLIKDVTAQIEELDTRKDAIRRGISRQSDYYKPSQVADATVMDTQKSDAMAQEKAFRERQTVGVKSTPVSSMVMKPAEDTLAGMANATPAQGQVKQPAASGVATPSIPATTQTAADYGDSVPATQAHREAVASTDTVTHDSGTPKKQPESAPDKHRELMTEALRLLGDIKTAMISGNKINQKTATNTA